MNGSATNGFLGSIILVAVIVALYFLATKKSPWNLRNPVPNGLKEKKWISVIIGAFILIALGLWRLPGTLGTPSLKTVGEVTQSYWLWLLLVGCIVYVLLSFIPKENGDLAKKSWTILTTFGLLLIVAMMWSWIAGRSSGHERQKQPEKVELMIPANGSLRIDTRPGYATRYTGTGFIGVCVYRDGRREYFPCKSGPMLYQEVTDTTGTKNMVTCEFLRP